MAVPQLDRSTLRLKKRTNDRVKKLPIPAFIRLPFRLASFLSPKWGGEAGRLVIFHPIRTRTTPAEQSVLDRAEKTYLRLEGRKLATYSWGEGPVVLLIHGWSGHAGQMIELVTPLNRAGFRVVAIDLPAHGASGGQLSSLVHFGRAIEAAAAHYGPVHAVVSHSLGGGGVVQALLNGLEAKRAVLIAAPAQLSDYWQLFRYSIGMSDAVWDALVARSERWLGIPFAEVHPEVGAARMRIPAIMLHGLSDRISPIAEGRRLVRNWPGAKLLEFDAGHLTILRDPKAVAETVRFIAR